MSAQKIVVVGAGATGLSTAWWLARAGHSVTVLDKGVVGWEASGRNGGGCSHYQSPLFKEEQRLWQQMDELLGYPTEFSPERIVMAVTPRQLEQYQYIAGMNNRLGHRVDLLDAQQVREAVPLAGGNCLGGIHYRFGGHANPHRTVQAYAWAIQDLGGRIVQHSPVTGFQTAGGKVTAVESTTGTFECDAVAIAAGPQTGRLAAMVGIDLPLAAARAEMIVTEPAPMMKLGGVDGNGLYGRQTLRGNLAYGGGPHEWLDIDGEATPRPVNTPVVASLARRLAEMFPRLGHVRVIRSWGGIIENTPDGRPILERQADPSNLVLATMSSVGFGLSPATGRALAQLVTQGHCDFADLSQLTLGRFGNLPLDWRARYGWEAAAM